MLEGYERAAPGLAATIVAMAEREQAHRIAMEQRLAEAEIEADRRQLAIEERRQQADAAAVRLGQVGGLLVYGATVGLAAWLISLGEHGYGIAMASVPVVGIIDSLARRWGSDRQGLRAHGR